MKLNVGGIDRILRIAAGLALVAWAALGGPAWAWIGIVPLATGLIGFMGELGHLRQDFLHLRPGRGGRVGRRVGGVGHRA